MPLMFQMTPTRGMSITDVSFGSDSSPHAVAAGIVPGGGSCGMAPLSLNSPNFVPRQHLVLTRVSESKGVEIIMYNITRDPQERLVKATDDLCHWVSARARLAETIVHQVCTIMLKSREAKGVPGPSNIWSN